jgi:hypothetical protein
VVHPYPPPYFFFFPVVVGTTFSDYLPFCFFASSLSKNDARAPSLKINTKPFGWDD